MISQKIIKSSYKQVQVIAKWESIRYIKPKPKYYKSNNISIKKSVYTFPTIVSSVSTPIDGSKTTLKFHFESLYRVILKYSDWKNDKITTQLLCKCVRIFEFNKIIKVVKNTRLSGTGILMTVLEEEAKMYRDRIISSGLCAYIEEA